MKDVLLDLPEYMPRVFFILALAGVTIGFSSGVYFLSSKKMRAGVFGILLALLAFGSSKYFFLAVDEYASTKSFNEKFFNSRGLTKICKNKKTKISTKFAEFEKNEEGSYECWEINCNRNSIRGCIDEMEEFYEKYSSKLRNSGGLNNPIGSLEG